MSTAAVSPSFAAGGHAGVSRGEGGVSSDSPRFKFEDLNASLREGKYTQFHSLRRQLSVGMNLSVC